MAFSPLRKKYLGEILLSQNLITREQLTESIAEQKKTGEKLGQILVRKKCISEDDLMKALSILYGMPMIKLSAVIAEGDALRAVPERLARRHAVIPFAIKDNVLQIAMADPADISAKDEIAAVSEMKLSVFFSSEQEIRDAIERYYGGRLEEQLSEDIESPEAVLDDADTSAAAADEEAADAAPIIKYVNSLLYQAVTKKASDIHLEPQEKNVALRFRIDGELVEFPSPPVKHFNAIVSRIKIIANLDIAERRLPQDGKSKLKVGSRKLDIRVSIMPTIHGEKVVMRLLDRSDVSLSIDDMGLSERNREVFLEALERPYGMILVTGPTGSGKTTTLYTGLNCINTPDRNIITVEDPVEYEMRKVNQVQVKSMIGLTFASVLRSILRQDPDVIMVGEIRDSETAQIAVQSALTGHLVLSTLHTNDTVSTLSRLRFMGVEIFLVADAVNLVMAQRLVRRICPYCKEEYKLPDNLRERLGIPDDGGKYYHGRGCDKCYGSGYKGRAAVMEMLKLTPAIRNMLITDKTDHEIKAQAIKEGMWTLRQSAVEKMQQGITTIDEVLSVTME